MTTTIDFRTTVDEALKVSNLRNDMREINSLAATMLRGNLPDEHRIALRTILRITRDAIYR